MKHLQRLVNAVWSLAMGGFLGLSSGLVLAVILAFHTARAVEARPGVAPYDDPMFSQQWADFIGGAIGRGLFHIGGSVGIALLALAGVALALQTVLYSKQSAAAPRRIRRLRLAMFAVVVVGMGLATRSVIQMDRLWPGLYDPAVSRETRDQSREQFNAIHNRSEQFVTIAWLAGFAALGMSPWCDEGSSTDAVASGQEG